jgi:ribonucleoside-diphosphate reductase alpha chain
MQTAESIGTSALALAPQEIERVHEHVHVEAAVTPERRLTDRRIEAKMKGYEGESCSECGNFTMVRNGTCLKCDSCGSTSGCS